MAKAQILVVEDDNIVVLELRDGLQSLGYAVCGVASYGEEAIEKARETRPDLVLMDIRLKGDVDGVEAAEEIRVRFDIPVVYLTAYADEDTLQRAKATEPYGYIIKPFQERELHTAIEVALYKHRAEEALRESEEKYRTLVELSLQGLVVVRDSRIVFTNTAFAEISGYTTEELLSLSPEEVKATIHPEDQALVWGRFRDRLAGKPVSPRYECRGIRKDGTVCWLEMFASRIEYGGKPAIQGAVMDITERKRAEEALLHSEERFRTLVETAPSLLHISDAKGNNIYVSPNCEEITGYTQEELLSGIRWWVHEDDTPRAREVFDRAFREGVGGKNFEYKAVKKNGEVWYASSSWERLRDKGGKFQGVVLQTIDITERKRTEEEIRRHTAQLEALRQVSLELTAELDLDALLRSIVSRAIELLDGTYGGLYLYQAEQDVLEWAVAVGPDLAPIGTVLRRGEGLSGKVWETGEPLIVDDYEQWEGRAAVYEDYPFRATVGVPVRWGGEFLGVLDVLADPPHTFSLADAELLSLLAQQAAIGIENARLYEEVQHRLREMNSLLEISRNITSTLEVDEVLRRVIEAAIATLGPAEKGTLHLLDEEREELVVRASVGFSPETVAAAHFKPGEGYTGWVFAHRQPVIIGDVKADQRTKPIDLPEVHDEKSALCAPLVVRDKTIGTLTLDNVTRYGAFAPEHLDLLAIFANQAAVAIENARLYERAQREIAERKRVEETIKRIAHHDELTGLPNRRLFNDRLHLSLAHAHRKRQKLAVMLLDLDHFKDVNDTLGHNVGDQLLQVVGERLTSLLREGDTIARMGGDEFMLLLPELVGSEDAAAIAQKILGAFRRPFVFDGHELRTTTSIGIAIYPEDGEDGDTLMKNADIAMYRAKDRGRDDYQSYTPAVEAKA